MNNRTGRIHIIVTIGVLYSIKSINKQCREVTYNRYKLSVSKMLTSDLLVLQLDCIYKIKLTICRVTFVLRLCVNEGSSIIA